MSYVRFQSISYSTIYDLGKHNVIHVIKWTSLCFCILQAIKNWTVGRPGNEASKIVQCQQCDPYLIVTIAYKCNAVTSFPSYPHSNEASGSARKASIDKTSRPPVVCTAFLCHKWRWSLRRLNMADIESQE